MVLTFAMMLGPSANLFNVSLSMFTVTHEGRPNDKAFGRVEEIVAWWIGPAYHQLHLNLGLTYSHRPPPIGWTPRGASH